jgi:hypothetical protein
MAAKAKTIKTTAKNTPLRMSSSPSVRAYGFQLNGKTVAINRNSVQVETVITRAPAALQFRKTNTPADGNFPPHCSITTHI